MIDQAVQGEEWESAAQEGETMQDMLDQYIASTGRLRKGDIRTGIVIDETENGWLLVDVGWMCEGILPLKEWTYRGLVEDVEKPKPGDQIEVEVINVREGEEAQLLLSRWRHEFDRRWAEFEEKAAQNETLLVKGLRKVNGGLTVNCCGLEGFIPASHLVGYKMENFIGREFEVMCLERDRRKHRLIFSQKNAAPDVCEIRKAIRENTIVQVVGFKSVLGGVLVKYKNSDGFLPISQIPDDEKILGLSRFVDQKFDVLASDFDPIHGIIFTRKNVSAVKEATKNRIKQYDMVRRLAEIFVENHYRIVILAEHEHPQIQEFLQCLSINITSKIACMNEIDSMPHQDDKEAFVVCPATMEYPENVEMFIGRVEAMILFNIETLKDKELDMRSKAEMFGIPILWINNIMELENNQSWFEGKRSIGVGIGEGVPEWLITRICSKIMTL